MNKIQVHVERSFILQIEFHALVFRTRNATVVFNIFFIIIWNIVSARMLYYNWRLPSSYRLCEIDKCLGELQQCFYLSLPFNVTVYHCAKIPVFVCEQFGFYFVLCYYLLHTCIVKHASHLRFLFLLMNPPTRWTGYVICYGVHHPSRLSSFWRFDATHASVRISVGLCCKNE